MKITTLMLGELASNCYIQEVGNKKCVIVDIGGDAPIVFRRLEMMQRAEGQAGPRDPADARALRSHCRCGAGTGKVSDSGLCAFS